MIRQQWEGSSDTGGKALIGGEITDRIRFEYPSRGVVTEEMVFHRPVTVFGYKNKNGNYVGNVIIKVNERDEDSVGLFGDIPDYGELPDGCLWYCDGDGVEHVPQDEIIVGYQYPLILGLYFQPYEE